MAGKPAEPPPPELPPEGDTQIDAPEHFRPGERSRPDELCGPVAIARHVKDDGRALILYTRDDAPPT